MPELTSDTSTLAGGRDWPVSPGFCLPCGFSFLSWALTIEKAIKIIKMINETVFNFF
jgi:hypothetical protein